MIKNIQVILKNFLESIGPFLNLKKEFKKMVIVIGSFFSNWRMGRFLQLIFIPLMNKRRSYLEIFLIEHIIKLKYLYIPNLMFMLL